MSRTVTVRGETAADAAEARELKKRIRLLEQENEVRRRAAAYLSQANLEQEVEILRRAAAYLSQATLSGPKGSTRS